jgi:hypothetical protein
MQHPAEISGTISTSPTGGRRLPRHGLRRAGSRGPRYTLPFAPLSSLRNIPEDHLENRRFSALPAARRDACWEARRSHAPCDELVPPEWGLDAIYFRGPEERGYAAAVRELTIRADARISADLLCLPRPLVPFDWGVPQTPCNADFANFSPNGDLPDSSGGKIALDSAWALREGSIADNAGDPGRLLSELRKEAKNTRKQLQFVPYHQVEYYDQTAEARQKYYPEIPEWFSDVWVFMNVFVPLPPVLTYRARFFLPGMAGRPEGDFYQKVLETEWTALVFARWCSDIPQRGIQWLLPPRVRANITAIGLDALLEGSRYRRSWVEQWLRDHDNHPWTRGKQKHIVRGPQRGDAGVVMDLSEFVRVYAEYRVFPRPAVPMGRWCLPSAVVGPSPVTAPLAPRATVSDNEFSVYPPLRSKLPPIGERSGVILPLHGQDKPEMARDAPTIGRGEVPVVAGHPIEERSPVWKSWLTPPYQLRDLARWAEDGDDEEVVASGTVPYPNLPVATEAPHSPELSVSLLRRLREAGLGDIIQYYARWASGTKGGSSRGSVSEEVLVEAFRHTNDLYLRETETVTRLRAREQELILDCEARVKRAEERSDLLASAYAVVGSGVPAGKRRRGE